MPPGRGTLSPEPIRGHATVARDVAAALSAWNVRADRVASVAAGSLNFNFEVRAGATRYFLRCYRGELETERIAGEHALVRWLAAREIRAPLPIELPGGATLLELAARRWALFPWVDHHPLERGHLDGTQARALGAAQGQLHAVLAAHPESAAASFPGRWSKAQSLERLERVAVEAATGRFEPWVLAGIRQQQRLLERIEALQPDHFAALPCQMLHGDFHDQQVLFRDRGVAAIVDWEIWHTDARAWEVVRSLAFSQLLDTPLMDAYLAGYREHVGLSEDEAHLALTLWWQSRIVGLWAWWAGIVEGNDRVRAFFPDTIAELGRVSDAAWTGRMRERFVQAACI